MTLTVGSLFAGIGGFDLGFERAGMRTEWFVEQDPYCQAVLRKHWPDVPVFDDVRDVGAHCLPPVDVLCGGFPCQDLSAAGKGAGLGGERSGLWFEFERLIGELRPGYVVVENVPLLRTRGLDTVISGLARLGYDAEWDVVSAAEAGAPHLRKRIWIVAYPQREQLREQPRWGGGACWTDTPLLAVNGEARPLANPQRAGLEGHFRETGLAEITEPRFGGAPLADADGDARQARRVSDASQGQGGRDADRSGIGANDLGNSDDRRRNRRPGAQPEADGWRQPADAGWWTTEPDVGRVAHGVPSRMDRLRALGNALVPQIAEEIGRRIVEYERPD